MPKTLSCGCCSEGCCCALHQDLRIGLRPAVCSYHSSPEHSSIESPDLTSSERDGLVTK